jgi:hypothetical protein
MLTQQFCKINNIGHKGTERSRYNQSVRLQTLLSPIDGSTKQKNQQRSFRVKYYITDIYSTFHSIAVEYTFFSAAYETFFRIDIVF